MQGRRRGSTVERALKVGTQEKVKSSVVEVGNEQEALAGFTERVLLSLVVDVTELRETAERLHIQVSTLARAHGIKPEPK